MVGFILLVSTLALRSATVNRHVRGRLTPLAEGIDATTPAGKLQMHILGAIAEFERGRIVERVKAGLVRARARGRKLGRPERQIPEHMLDRVRGLSVREAAVKLGVSPATAHRWLSQKINGARWRRRWMRECARSAKQSARCPTN